MLSMYFFGRFIENRFGSRPIFNLYLGGVLLGGLFIMMQNAKKRNNFRMELHLGITNTNNTNNINYINCLIY